MNMAMTSCERMLAAIECAELDCVPCSFMLFFALRRRCDDDEQFIRKQVELGLDAVIPVDIPGRPCAPGTAYGSPTYPISQPLPEPYVDVQQWREEHAHGPDILHKQWTTPDGTLKSEVRLTPDWAGLQDVPLFDDYLVPRAQKFPVEKREDIAALRHVLGRPTAEQMKQFSADLAVARELANELGLLVQLGEGMGVDAGAWLCGLERQIFYAVDDPGMVEELAQILHEWNMAWMEVTVGEGVDLSFAVVGTRARTSGHRQCMSGSYSPI